MSNPLLNEIRRALGGKIVGAQVVAPGPGHSSKDASLSIRPTAMNNDGFVVHSYCGDDPIICRDYVRAKLGRPSFKAGRRDHRIVKPILQRVGEPAATVWAESFHAALWNTAKDPLDTPVQSYLGSRCIDLAPELAGDVIRFHKNCPFERERYPAMLCLVRNIVTNEPQAIHRTALSPDGTAIKRDGKTLRLSLGPVAAGAIKLASDEDVCTGLHVGEGLETCLSALQLGFAPCWSLISVGGISKFPILGGVEALTILEETGEASARAIDECGQRWRDAGREVWVVSPTSGSDINDSVREAVGR